MGRPKNWPPVPKTHKGRDRVWWNGRWWDLGKSGSPAAKAEFGRLVSLWAVDPTAAARRADDYLVAELCRDYLASDAAPTEDRQRGRAVRAVSLLLDLHLATAVADFGAAEYEAWQAALCRMTGDDGEPLFNRTYIGHLTAVIKAAWKWGIRSRRTTWDQYHELCSVPGPRFEQCREPEPVLAADPAAIPKVLPHVRPPVRAMVRLQQLTGARPGELCILRPGDVHRSGRVELPGVGFVDLDAEGVWVYVPDRHKKKSRGKPRWVVFGEAAQDVLRPFLDRDPAAFCFSPSEALEDLRQEQRAERAARKGGSGGSRKPKGAKQTRRPAPRYTPRTYLQAITRGCVKAGVEPFTAYQLRHLFAAETDFEFGLDATQAAMGHDKPDTTRVYTKRSFKAAAKVARERG